MGTIYTRVNSVQSNVEVAFKNEQKVIEVERISVHPDLEITNDYSFELR